MISSKQRSRASKIGNLAPEQQAAVFAHCEGSTLDESVRWLLANYNLKIERSCLAEWLRARRAQRSLAISARKIRPDSKLGMLEPAQRDAVFLHCEHITQKEGVLWIKEQFNVDLSASALGIWLQKRRIDANFALHLESIRDDNERASLVAEVFGAAATLTKANCVLIAQAVFEEFRKPAAERDEKRLSQYMNLALKGRTVDLAYDRLYIDCAKKASKHAAEIQKINDGEGDETEKIEEVMRLLFGEEPENTMFEGAGSAASPCPPKEGEDE